jgi:hypothetical protein
MDKGGSMPSPVDEAHDEAYRAFMVAASWVYWQTHTPVEALAYVTKKIKGA